ncbi:MAG: DUF3592 domain-containing protein [Gammaproteobacteria bacterium]|nr:DUF3592 domain-containing protein [Gammaproteobacteria bacterium]NIM72725.1 DUF3592 domain-containing protein [Gammaproteobacteria bacterium]NIN38182.1 DUF3592 domain-containing protein [Gammaproteobacteria bacterium]NIO24473.1 DUF3592 domain-containing protein [Gammaproteobacteria bacterium]NIO65082.1 DUF3592 domain-containing protein [Gammaproteobacteria bacterium]
MDGFQIFLGGIFVFGGLYLLLETVLNVNRTFKSKSWPQTTGIIQDSKVVAVDNDEGVSFEPVVTYQYEVGTQQFSSRCVYFLGVGFGYPLPFFSRRLVKKYPSGKRVAVFFDPSDPKNATLIPGLNRHAVYLLIVTVLIGIVFAGAGVLLVREAFT